MDIIQNLTFQNQIEESNDVLNQTSVINPNNKNLGTILKVKDNLLYSSSKQVKEYKDISYLKSLDISLDLKNSAQKETERRLIFEIDKEGLIMFNKKVTIREYDKDLEGVHNRLADMEKDIENIPELVKNKLLFWMIGIAIGTVVTIIGACWMIITTLMSLV